MKWEKVKLGKYVEILSGYAFKSKDFLNCGVPVIKIKNITQEGVTLEDVSYISKELADKNEKYHLNYNDILIALTGSHINQMSSVVGRIARIKYHEDSLLNQRVGKVFAKDSKLCDIDYVYYFLSQDYIKISLASKAGGAANQANISPNDVKSLTVRWPDIETQHRIADILSAYDDLIENNQKQIKLLEEAAQRLYKEWFVVLRFPGHENTKIVDGVPEGWRVASIADICDTVGGGTPSTKIQSYYEKGDILWVTPTDITRNFSLALLDTEKKITPEGLKNSSAKMLPAETILMTSRASVGFFGMCKYEVCTNQGFISCIPKRENLQMYLLFNLKSRVEEIRQKAGGSTYLEISKTVFRELKIILPKDEVLAEYQKNVHDIFDEIYCRTEMIKSLVDMRNRLLPKLMSGEVEV